MGKVYMMPGGVGFFEDPPCLIYIDTEGNLQSAKINSISEICVYGGDTSTITVDGHVIVKNSIVAVFLDGIKESVIPNYFCEWFTSLAIITLPANPTTIGDSFMDYCTSFNSRLVLPASITSIGHQFMRQCRSFNGDLTLPANLKTIGDNFMYSCALFNRNLTLPANLTTIGVNFMYNCASFNGVLTLPANLKTIGNKFMEECTSFNRNLTLPASITSIGNYFMSKCNAYISTLIVNANPQTWPGDEYTLSPSKATDAAFTSGVKIGGTYSAQFRAKYPNKTSYPFRKLIAA